MIQAIKNYKIKGVSTTLLFGTFVCEHKAFRSGDFDTHFVKKYFNAEQLIAQQTQEAEVAAIVALKQYLKDKEILRVANSF